VYGVVAVKVGRFYRICDGSIFLRVWFLYRFIEFC